MDYRFDEQTDRRGTFSLKWNVPENELPMWVADMDFPAAPEICETILQRVRHGIFGYTYIPDEWYEAVTGWWKTRHHFPMEKEWLLFCSGIVPAIGSTIRRLTAPGEKIILLTPVYNAFFRTIADNGRYVLKSTMRYDGTSYEADFEDLEKKLADPDAALLIFCNPHNPVGKIWDRRTMEKVGELCRKYHVPVLADEIHCDLTDPGKEYIPFASVSEACRQNSITFLSPTKTFNLAGIQTAAVAVPDEKLRNRVARALHVDGAAEPNAFAMETAIAAYSKGGPWLDALREYIFENKKTAKSFIEKEIPQIGLVPSEATYLLWLDCSRFPGKEEPLASFLRREAGLYLVAGEQYGMDGKDFLRMNIACPKSVLEDGLERLKKGIHLWAAREQME